MLGVFESKKARWTSSSSIPSSHRTGAGSIACTGCELNRIGCCRSGMAGLSLAVFLREERSMGSSNRW